MPQVEEILHMNWRDVQQEPISFKIICVTLPLPKNKKKDLKKKKKKQTNIIARQSLGCCESYASSAQPSLLPIHLFVLLGNHSHLAPIPRRIPPHLPFHLARGTLEPRHVLDQHIVEPGPPFHRLLECPQPPVVQRAYHAALCSTGLDHDADRLNILGQEVAVHQILNEIEASGPVAKGAEDVPLGIQNVREVAADVGCGLGLLSAAATDNWERIGGRARAGLKITDSGATTGRAQAGPVALAAADAAGQLGTLVSIMVGFAAMEADNCGHAVRIGSLMARNLPPQGRVGDEKAISESYG